MLNGGSINSHVIDGSPSLSITSESILENLTINDIVSSGGSVLSESSLDIFTLDDIVSSIYLDNILEDFTLDDLVSEIITGLFNELITEDLTLDDLALASDVIVILENITAQELLVETRMLAFFETITLSSAILSDVIEGILEHLQTQDLLSSSGIFTNLLLDNVSLDEILKLIFKGDITDIFTLDDTAQITVSLLSKISEIINTSDSASESLFAINELIETIILSDIVLHSFREGVTDNLTITQSSLDLLTMLSELSSNIALTLNSTDTILLISSIGESFTLDDISLSNQETTESILDNVEMIVVNSGDDIFSGWVLNPETFAIWNYDNYNFNSIATLNQQTFLANTSGLFTMEGNLDNTAFIQSRLKTRSYDFGSTNLKQVPDMYIGLSMNGRLIIGVQTDERLEVKYELSLPTEVSDLQTVKLGKGLRGSSWQFELIDSESTQFDLTSIEWLPIIFGRKRR